MSKRRCVVGALVVLLVMLGVACGAPPTQPPADTQPPSSDCTNLVPSADLHGCDLSGRNLARLNLAGVNLQGANLRGADLQGVVLDDADLSSANLSGVDLRTVSMRHVRMTDTNLQNADLRNVDFGCRGEREDASGVLLAGANLTGTTFCDYQMTNVDLRGRDLTAVNFQGVRLEGADLRDTNLSGVNFGISDRCWDDDTGCQPSLRGANLTGAVLDGTSLQLTDMTNAVLPGVDLSRIFAVPRTLAGANLRRVNVEGVKLSVGNCNYDEYGTDFSGADMQEGVCCRFG